jgi:hypothetical protein
MMNSELEGGVYVALKGRVPCKVTGLISKGQRLVAGPAGTASAMLDASGPQDCFAIALESFGTVTEVPTDHSSETGTIEVLVL